MLNDNDVIMLEPINAIANPVGWIYKPRKSMYERRFGYMFIGLADDDKAYFTRIRADNPVDAAHRLRPISEVKKLLPASKPNGSFIKLKPRITEEPEFCSICNQSLNIDDAGYCIHCKEPIVDVSDTGEVFD